jgi:hypothetical protein
LAAVTLPTRAQDFGPDTGVMCAYGIVLAVDQIGEACFPGKLPPLRAELQRAIPKYEAFIKKNLPATDSQLAAGRAELVLQGTRSLSKADEEGKKKLCREHPLTSVFRDPQQAESMMKMLNETDQFLATPRKPTMNQCE